MEEACKLSKEKDNADENDDEEESTDDEMDASEDDASECKDADEANDEAAVVGNKEKMKLLRKRSHHALSGRGITLSMLLIEGIIEPGSDYMSLDYLGQKFMADLLPDGRIKWKEEDAIFCSPSAWASHCKKMVNPDKRSGCGWSSVRYRGRKLDALKSLWFKKHRQLSQDRYVKSEKEEVDSKKLKLSPVKKIDESPSVPVLSSPGVAKTSSVITSPSAIPISQSTNHSSSVNQPTHQQQQFSPRPWTQVKHSSLGRVFTEHDRRTLVECSTFAAVARIQPFNLSMTPSCLAIIDFHCHQLTTEVLGYIGGKWDPTMQQLQLLKAYPLLQRAHDEQSAAKLEQEIQEVMFGEGLILVGWYHSHPFTPASPSLADIEAQMAYQLMLKAPGNTFQPCVAVIVAPYESTNHKESSLTVYWVMPPSEQRPLDFGVPVNVEFCTQDEDSSEKTFLTIMESMSTIYARCQKEPSAIHMMDKWSSVHTFADKVKVSVTKRLKDKSYRTLIDFLKTLLH